MVACGGDGGTGPTDPGPTAPQPASIEITPAADTLTALGATVQLSARVLASDGSEITNAEVEWTCEDCGIVSVDAATGTATAIANGIGAITATVTGTTVSASAEIQVFQVAVSVTVTPEAPTLSAIGATQQFEAVAVDANDNAIEGAPVLWISGNHAVATIDNAGLATATGPGTAEVTAAVQGVPGTVTLTISQAAASLAFVTQPSTTAAGAEISPAVQVQIQDGNGNRVTGATAAVTLAIETNPGAGTLSGTTTVAAIEGVATFSGLAIDAEGAGYTLSASSGSMTAATSAAFDVLEPRVPTSVMFVQQPSAIKLGQFFEPAVQVAVVDQHGEILTSSQALVGIGKESGPGYVSGQTLVQAWNGVATFSTAMIAGTPGDHTLEAWLYWFPSSSRVVSETITVSAKAALLANTTYVDYSAGTTSSEASNVEASMEAFNWSVSTFTDISSTGITAAVAGQDVLIIPEQENGALLPALSSAALDAISTFVSDGGTLIVFGSSSERDAAIANAVLGTTIVNLGTGSGTYTLDAAAAAGTEFQGGYASIPSLSATWRWSTGSLPPDAVVYYEGTASDAVVVTIPLGAGEVVYLGWDWFNAAPTGTENGGWLEVLRRAAAY